MQYFNLFMFSFSNLSTSYYLQFLHYVSILNNNRSQWIETTNCVLNLLTISSLTNATNILYTWFWVNQRDSQLIDTIISWKLKFCNEVFIVNVAYILYCLLCTKNLDVFEHDRFSIVCWTFHDLTKQFSKFNYFSCFCDWIIKRKKNFQRKWKQNFLKKWQRQRRKKIEWMKQKEKTKNEKKKIETLIF